MAGFKRDLTYEAMEPQEALQYDPHFFDERMDYVYLVHQGVRFGFICFIEREEGAAELSWFIFPACRNTLLAKNRVLQFFKEAVALGYSTLYMHTSHASWPQTLKRFGMIECEPPVWGGRVGGTWLKKMYGEVL